MGKERQMIYLAGVFSSLQESYTNHVLGNLPRVGSRAVGGGEDRSLQALQGVWVVSYKEIGRDGGWHC